MLPYEEFGSVATIPLEDRTSGRRQRWQSQQLENIAFKFTINCDRALRLYIGIDFLHLQKKGQFNSASDDVYILPLYV